MKKNQLHRIGFFVGTVALLSTVFVLSSTKDAQARVGTKIYTRVLTETIQSNTPSEGCTTTTYTAEIKCPTGGSDDCTPQAPAPSRPPKVICNPPD